VILQDERARLHCLDEVSPKHVKEAGRLLNKSIIRVETPDVNFIEQEDTNVMEEDEDKENDSSAANRDSTQASVDATQTTKKPLTMNFEEYKRLGNTLVLYIRQREEEEELRSASPDSMDIMGGEGIRKSELVNWYLEQISDDIEDENELLQQRQIYDKVIYRLTHHDKILIELSTMDDDLSKSQSSDAILVVHPNYVVEA
jgi:DNA replication licensing factor MCM6